MPIPTPCYFYIGDFKFESYLIEGLPYRDPLYSHYEYRRFFNGMTDEEISKYATIVKTPPGNGYFYFIYISMPQEFIHTLGLQQRDLRNITPLPQPLSFPPAIHNDIKSGRAHIILDNSVEGSPAERFSIPHLEAFLGEYRNFVYLASSDYQVDTAEIIPTIYRNTWERYCKIVLGLPEYRKSVIKFIDPKLKTPTHRPFKCLMKNRIFRDHRLALSFMVANDKYLNQSINYSFASAGTYNVDQTISLWKRHCQTAAKRLSQFFRNHDMNSYFQKHDIVTTFTEQNIKEYALANPMKNLVGEDIDLNENQSTIYKEELFQIHSNSYFQVVTETYFKENNLFVSEKIFQPIMMKQPFVVAGQPYLVKLMRIFGYDMFDDIIDHSYDLETDHSTRMLMLYDEIKRLSQIDDDTWAKTMVDIRLRLENNVDNLHRSHTRFNKIEVHRSKRVLP